MIHVQDEHLVTITLSGFHPSTVLDEIQGLLLRFIGSHMEPEPLSSQPLHHYHPLGILCLLIEIVTDHITSLPRHHIDKHPMPLLPPFEYNSQKNLCMFLEEAMATSPMTLRR